MRMMFLRFGITAVLLALSVPAMGFKPLYVDRATEGTEKSRIEIVEFVPNNYIYGRVRGMPSSECGNYKVIVYVKTDRWYIHPYERGGDGLSYATLNSRGEWRINTIRRSLPADKVAFFLVNRDYAPPSSLNDAKVVGYRLVLIEDGDGRI